MRVLRSNRGLDGRGLAVLTMVLVLGLCASSAMAQTGVLTGTVTDADTSEPIEGALVVARGDGMGGPHGSGRLDSGGHPGGPHGPRHAFTDANGSYTIEELEAGDYDVACGTPGYSVAYAGATIADGETTVLDFALEPLTFGAVAGHVTDASTGMPIAGARVVLLRPHIGEVRSPSGDDAGESMWLHAVTGDDGTYSIDNVPSGDYEARAMSFGYLRSEPVPVTVVEGETAQVDLELMPLTFGSLEGHVTDTVTGAPIEGAIVFAFQHAPWMPGPGERGQDGESGRWNFARTDADGFYRFDELSAGIWTVRAFSWGYYMGQGEAEVVADETAVLDLSLEPR